MKDILHDEKLNTLNHSCAHLLAQAVKHLYPNAKFWVGPVIDDGFYYDIDLGEDVIKEDDLPKIEKEMKKIAKDGKRIVRHEISKDEALEANVLASRLNSCIIKSSLLPQIPPVCRIDLTSLMWAFNLSYSSLTSAFCAASVTSCSIRLGSISIDNSAILALIFSLSLNTNSDNDFSTGKSSFSILSSRD